jgi:hypothetical protein
MLCCLFVCSFTGGFFSFVLEKGTQLFIHNHNRCAFVYLFLTGVFFVLFLEKGTNEEQGQTIKLQKSTIGSLKEEVELLTRQIGEHNRNNQINVEKQKQVFPFVFPSVLSLISCICMWLRLCDLKC